MDLPISAKTYSRYYRKVGPLFKKPRVRAYTMLVLSLFTMSFFGVFAIRPTFTTIARLRKEIDDSQLVNEALERKIIHLSQIKEEYKKIEDDLPLISEALPPEPKLSFFLRELETLAQETGATVTAVKLEGIDLSQKEPRSPTQISSSLALEGDYPSCKAFLEKLLNSKRIYLVDRFEIHTFPRGEAGIINLNLKINTYYLEKAYVQ